MPVVFPMPHEVLAEIQRALGLDKPITSITIKASADDMATVQVEYLPDERETKDLTQMLSRYLLVPAD
jgi:hypothetical protein